MSSPTISTFFAILLSTTSLAFSRPAAAGVAAPYAQTAPTPTSSAPTTGFEPGLVITMVTTVISNGASITVETPLDLGVVPPPVEPVRLPRGTINIALLGTDTRPAQGGLNTDVIMIASLHPSRPVVTLLSIPRDTLVYIPGKHMHKVNTAYNKGVDTFRATILYNFGIDLDYFALVDFGGVVNTVDALGGIEVVATCPLHHVFPKDPYYFADEANPNIVTQPYTDSFTGEAWVVGAPVPTQTIDIPRPGVYELNGMETLAFARARYGVPGGDVDRGRRAQRVVRAVLNELRRSATLATIPSLYTQYAKSVVTDIKLADVIAMATQAERLDALSIRNRYFDSVGMTAVTLPRVGSVLIPDHRDAVTDYMQRALSVSDNVRANDGIPVELWNATPYDDYTAAATDRLRELGFVVVDSKRVPSQPKSQIIDYSTSSKGSAVPLLQRSFGLSPQAIVSEPQQRPDGVRYRIVAGADFDTCYQHGYEYPIRAMAAPPAVATPLTVTAATAAPLSSPTAAPPTPQPTSPGAPTPKPQPPTALPPTPTKTPAPPPIETPEG